VPVDHASLDDPAFFRLNDLVVDDAGRAYVGNFGFDLDAFLADPAAVPMAPTRLVRVDPDGSTTTAAEDLLFPNGMVITPDGGTLVVAETFASHLTAFDRAADGTLSGRRVWAPLPGVAPDGICLDADGHVWVANALADECLLLAEGGGILDRVVTSRPCFACMLGGEDRRTLYLVTATSSLEALASRRRLGRIEQVRVDVPGTGRP
jgi:sugar lactone lactonase YvrE